MRNELEQARKYYDLYLCNGLLTYKELAKKHYINYKKLGGKKEMKNLL